MKFYSDFKKKEILQYTTTWLNKDIIKTVQYKKYFMNKGAKKKKKSTKKISKSSSTTYQKNYISRLAETFLNTSSIFKNQLM